MKLLRGKLVYDSKQNDSVFSDDNEVFYYGEESDTAKKRLTKEELENWALILNSPWSQKDMNYTIELNCKDAYTARDTSQPEWRCLYTVVGYDMITGVCIGYGNTEEEALQDCKTLLDYLQMTYNPDDDSV